MLYNVEKEEIPHKIFRYSPWNEYTRDVIENRHIFLAPIKSLNDKFEFRIDGIPLDNKLECTSGIDSINFEVDEVDITSSFVQRGKEVDESLEELTRFEREYTRISCFTTENNNTMMWNFYGDKYMGVCLEWTDLFSDIDSTADILGKVRYGRYSDAVEAMKEQRYICINTLNMGMRYREHFPGELTMLTSDIWAKYFFKSYSWNGENEYRLIRCSTANDSFNEYYNYKKSQLTGVYCGIDMPEDEKRNVYEFVREQNDYTTVYIAQYKKNNWGFEFLPYQPQ